MYFLYCFSYFPKSLDQAHNYQGKQGLFHKHALDSEVSRRGRRVLLKKTKGSIWNFSREGGWADLCRPIQIGRTRSDRGVGESCDARRPPDGRSTPQIAIGRSGILQLILATRVRSDGAHLVWTRSNLDRCFTDPRLEACLLLPAGIWQHAGPAHGGAMTDHGPSGTRWKLHSRRDNAQRGGPRWIRKASYHTSRLP
jgi:hypothetical protein